MLRADDLTLSYHRNGPAVLDGVTFTEEPGRLVAVPGASTLPAALSASAFVG